MVKVRYVGSMRYGTLKPRIVWQPGEIRDVDEEAAKELLQDPWFRLVKPKKKPKKKARKNESTEN